MMPEIVVQACWASGTDMAPLVAVVTALVRMYIQRNVVAYRNRALRSRMRGVRGTEVVHVAFVLLLSHALITDLLVAFPDALAKHRYAVRVACVNVAGGEGEVSCEGLAYFGICDVGRGCEVLEEVGGDVLLMGEYAP